MKEREIRTNRSTTRITRSATGQPQLSGYGAVYNSLSEDLGGGWGSFREKIAPGAFESILRTNPDVMLLRDHNVSLLLARTKNKTLSLNSDSVGLRFVADLPDTALAEETETLVANRTLDGCSFAFTVKDQEWLGEKDPQGQLKTVRTILSFESLSDVSIVTYPAYLAASLDSRSLWPDGTPAEVRKRLGTPLGDAERASRARGLLKELGLRSVRQEDEVEPNANDCTCPCTNCAADSCPDCNCDGCGSEECANDSCQCAGYRGIRRQSVGRTIYPVGSTLAEAQAAEFERDLAWSRLRAKAASAGRR